MIIAQKGTLVKTLIHVALVSILLFGTAFAQLEGDVIINEIGTHGTSKTTYRGADFVELLVLKPEGVKLGGWYLTDLSSISGNPKETEGLVRFADTDGSVFQQTIPQGTYILVWLSAKDSVEALKNEAEDVSVADGNNRITVFAYDSPKHIDKQDGYMNLTGKDNVVVLSSWRKDGSVDQAAWGGSTKWTGCVTTELPMESMKNGSIARFSPKKSAIPEFRVNTDSLDWTITQTESDATPGLKNIGVDDACLTKK
jgi:hypothetical protein